MAEEFGPGSPLLGVGRQTTRAPNTFALWQYLLIAAVLLIGALYAAPNLFQPDPALQLRATSTGDVVTAGQLERLTGVLG